MLSYLPLNAESTEKLSLKLRTKITNDIITYNLLQYFYNNVLVLEHN